MLFQTGMKTVIRSTLKNKAKKTGWYSILELFCSLSMFLYLWSLKFWRQLTFTLVSSYYPSFWDLFFFFLIQLYLEFLENSVTHFHQWRTQILTRILCSIFIFAKVLVWHLYHHVAYTYSYHLPVKMAFLVSITSAGRMKFRLDSKALYAFLSPPPYSPPLFFFWQSYSWVTTFGLVWKG